MTREQEYSEGLRSVDHFGSMLLEHLLHAWSLNLICVVAGFAGLTRQRSYIGQTQA